MDTRKESAVGKANATKAKDLFDLPLIHVLTVLLGLQLDTRHARVRNILNANECYGWSDFKNKHVDEWLKEEYNDTQSGIIFRFNRFDRERFNWVRNFQAYLMDEQFDEVDLDDPCTWSLDIWNKWRLQEDLKSINSQVGIDVNIPSKLETTISALSSPEDILKKETSPSKDLKKRQLCW